MVVNALGEKAPSLLIFEGKRHTLGLLNGAPKGSLIAMQENGWINTQLFESWFL